MKYLARIFNSLIGTALVCAILIAAVCGLIKVAGGDAQAAAAGNEMHESDLRVSVFTDAGTGCQYLGMFGEAVTPRIAADGKTHMGCKGAGK